MTVVVGWLFIPETKDRKIWEEVHALEEEEAARAATPATATT